MNILLFAAVDLLAICVLTTCLYLPRHRRRDLVVSYFGINVGVFAVATALSSSTVGVGLGMGLFGVLSIIRLRSTELEQHEIAYYFSALAIGLISGMGPTPAWIPIALIALILVVMLLVDNAKVLPRYRHQEVVLDRTFTTEQQLESYLSTVLGGAKIHQYSVQLLDLVNDKTVVRARFSTPDVPVADSTAGLQGLTDASIPRTIADHEVIAQETR
ncbi:DUF4956 domain-containing protein [Glutamicibacter sp.]|uniref:DUF4956 domain-containing protein n=1 Tax=Glutamicibacter sp. TaxID=1931995 RepID=UPI0028BDEA83|nr:DUF4956 domain-containing protein [Glutamicibacter sp.]